MFIAALIGNRPFFIIADLVGIFFWFNYVSQISGIEKLLDFGETYVCIGAWIAVAIFIVSFFTGLATGKEQEDKPKKQGTNVEYVSNSAQIHNTFPFDRYDYGESNFYDSSNLNTQKYIEMNPVSSQEDNDIFKYCPYCGAKINGNVRFCGKCGHKL